MEVHFIDVGCGNMTLILFHDGTSLMYDCNLTDENRDRVFSYLNEVIDGIDCFVNSHRDADHMRGIADLHSKHPIKQVWDSGVPGTTTDCPEYEEFMTLRRSLPFREIEPRKYWTFGDAKLMCLNSKWEDYSDPNEQSLVFKIECHGVSVMLAGDTNYRPWKEKIVPYFGDMIRSSILLASHHGSLTFFDDPADSQNYYTGHVARIQPDMTIVSVGPNVHGLPDGKALELYKGYSKGSDQGTKIHTTAEQGTMKLTLKDEGRWELFLRQ